MPMSEAHDVDLRQMNTTHLLLPHTQTAQDGGGVGVGGGMEGHQCDDEVAVPRSRNGSQQVKAKAKAEQTMAESGLGTRKAGRRGECAAAAEEEKRLDQLHADYVRWLAATEGQQRR